MKSIIQEDRTCCYLCGENGSRDPLERHHVFGGSNRKKADADGLTVYLCGSRCHRNGELSAHRSKETAYKLHQIAQEVWMSKNEKSEEDFRNRYGKSYL